MPKFILAPSDSVAVQDTLARFECIIDAMPKPKLQWFLNDKELSVKDNVKFETDAKTSANVLVIPKISTVFVGSYTVKASNSVGDAEHKFQLNVNGNWFFIYWINFIDADINLILEVPKVIGKLENVTVNEGHEAKFIVKFSGKPKPSVTWYKEEEEIITTVEESYEVIETEDTVQFIIKSVKPENSGNYFAQLNNEAGSISSNKAQLLVNS